MTRVCKSCLTKTSLLDSEIQEAIHRLETLKNVTITKEAIYHQRLEQCAACQYLSGNTTCLQCGCIVQILAKVADGKCPFPKKSRWKDIS